jgi:hypothetical protein
MNWYGQPWMFSIVFYVDRLMARRASLWCAKETIIPSFVLVCTCMPLRMFSLSASCATTSDVGKVWSEEIGLIMYAQCSGAHCLEFCWMLLKKMSLTRGRDAMVPAVFFVWRKC